jgi:hypothetical protein
MEKETLGIMVTKYDYLVHIVGVVKAARKAGHPVSIFLNDEGVKFAHDPKFLELLKISDVEISCCNHSCKVLGLGDKTEGISYGSQFDNAKMLHTSARVLVF